MWERNKFTSTLHPQSSKAYTNPRVSSEGWIGVVGWRDIAGWSNRVINWRLSSNQPNELGDAPPQLCTTDTSVCDKGLSSHLATKSRCSTTRSYRPCSSLSQVASLMWTLRKLIDFHLPWKTAFTSKAVFTPASRRLVYRNPLASFCGVALTYTSSFPKPKILRRCIFQEKTMAWTLLHPLGEGL